jgi:uncharacterized cupredoxin-like copper-binding protein
MTRRDYLLAALVTVALTTASLLAIAAWSSGPGPGRPTGSGPGPTATSCAVPATLPGQPVRVVLADMGGPMMGGPRRGGPMRLRAAPQTVPAGTVTLIAVNHGYRTHELVVLPLAAGAQVGTRPSGADGTIAETGSLGEASRNCAAGSGDGITPGAASWVSLSLAPGRYELVCNEPGHYAAGMFIELDVVS